MTAGLLMQQLIVAAAVLVCTGVAGWRLASVRQRLKLLDALERLPAAPLPAWRARLRRRLLTQLTSACGGCSVRPVAATRNQTPGAPRR